MSWLKPSSKEIPSWIKSSKSNKSKEEDSEDEKPKHHKHHKHHKKRVSINEAVLAVFEDMGPTNSFDNADFDVDRQSGQDLEIVHRKGTADRKDPKTYKRLDDEKDNEKIDPKKQKGSMVTNNINDKVTTNVTLEAMAGKHKDLPLQALNKTQLKLGIDVEKEHSDTFGQKLQIAKDHLAEIPDYYSRLNKMEDDANKGKPVFSGR